MSIELLKEIYKDKTCLVTGGAGFIGSALVKALTLQFGCKVISYDIKDNGYNDVRSLENLQQAFQEHKVDCVFHLAAKTEVAESVTCPYMYYSTNVEGTINVLTCAKEEQVKSIVIASTDKVYGNQRIPYKESASLLKSEDAYSNSKRTADLICQDYAYMYMLPMVILRSCNTYGEGQSNCTTLITRTIKNLIKRYAPIVHKGMGTSIREWMHIRDAVKAYLYAGACNLKNIPAEYIWNVGSGECYTVEEVIYMIKESLNIFVPNIMIDDSIKRTGNQAVNCSIMKAMLKSEFDHIWEPMSLSEGIKRAVAFYRQ